MSDDYDDDNDYELLEESERDRRKCYDYVQQEVWDSENVDEDVDNGDVGGDDNDDDEN